MSTVVASQIELDERGRPWIRGANTKVVEVVLDHVAWGWSAEKIQEEHEHLSLGQVYAALGYYYDNKAEMDAEMQRQKEEIDRLAADAGPSPVAERLRRLGLLK